MRICCDVLRNSRVTSIAMTFLGNKFSFNLDLYFMRYVHANTKNKMRAPKKLFIFELFILIESLFDFLIILCLDQSQKPRVLYRKKWQGLN